MRDLVCPRCLAAFFAVDDRFSGARCPVCRDAYLELVPEEA